ncbi:response regulator [Haloplanus litoreus]|uniref:response regulator n=1 Tax=Haloplanus litoreus TaxID=767515 RepID=UPI00362270D5
MGETTASARVLLVDDDREFAATTADYLGGQSDSLVVETATSADDALDRLSRTTFDCVVSDWGLPRRTASRS